MTQTARCVLLTEGPLKVTVWLDSPGSTYLCIGEPGGAGMVRPEEVAALVDRAVAFDRLVRTMDIDEGNENAELRRKLESAHETIAHVSGNPEAFLEMTAKLARYEERIKELESQR